MTGDKENKGNMTMPLLAFYSLEIIESNQFATQKPGAPKKMLTIPKQQLSDYSCWQISKKIQGKL